MLIFCPFSYSTPLAVASAPLPAVPGMARCGRGFSCSSFRRTFSALPAQSQDLTAFAVSMAEPPPREIRLSQPAASNRRTPSSASARSGLG